MLWECQCRVAHFSKFIRSNVYNFVSILTVSKMERKRMHNKQTNARGAHRPTISSPSDVIKMQNGLNKHTREQRARQGSTGNPVVKTQSHTKQKLHQDHRFDGNFFADMAADQRLCSYVLRMRFWLRCRYETV